MIKVTIYNEYLHERHSEAVKAIYPDGMHRTIADALVADGDITVRSLCTLEDPECGLTEEVLSDTDVLLWWGHMGHDRVPDEVADRVWSHVLSGMGLIVLHSGHHSKIFRKLMGTSCNLHWREDDRERVWNVNPSHPIAAGVPESFELEHEEMYGEPFCVPEPLETVFLGWFQGGEVFRAGMTYRREKGNIFYFQPGHEEYPTYHNETVQLILRNAVRWAFNPAPQERLGCPWVESPEKLRNPK